MVAGNDGPLEEDEEDAEDEEGAGIFWAFRAHKNTRYRK